MPLPSQFSTPEAKTTLLLALGVGLSFCLLMFVMKNQSRQQSLIREIDEWRNDNKFALFLEWLREHPEHDGRGGD